ncbi:hypothetical protein [Sphingomonas oligophenolica]|uniref:Uncharacterized protein n=1 Tax=Sphingomonas oligophenolica TaxID=301154 RepID=A0A502CDS6_9SPHN|nr:hypothetical protein [Sphingomonas oligophenolica]TPG10832.1 hypothetical protein EAH84_12185 [Sphingomonas oligophenolica]
MDRTVRQALADLRASLEVRIADARREIEVLEAELADTRTAEKALMPKVERLEARGHGASQFALSYWSKQAVKPIRDLTMKELVRKALAEQFPNGATARMMLDFFHNAWGRTDIIRSSFSPQLSRMKGDEEIILEGMVWKLAATAEQADNPGALAPNENEPPNGKPADGSETALAAQ